MIGIKLTEELKKIILKMVSHEVFSLVLSDYEIDDKYIYVPRDRIKDKTQLKILIKKGKVIETPKE